MLLYVPDAFTLASLMAKEDNIVGVALRIVGADDAKECGLACSVLAAEAQCSPFMTVKLRSLSIVRLP